MTTPSPTGTRKAGLRKFRKPPQHNVLNNHYRPLIKLNYRESRELAPPEQGKGNYENFVKSPHISHGCPLSASAQARPH